MRTAPASSWLPGRLAHLSNRPASAGDSTVTACFLRSGPPASVAGCTVRHFPIGAESRPGPAAIVFRFEAREIGQARRIESLLEHARQFGAVVRKRFDDF